MLIISRKRREFFLIGNSLAVRVLRSGGGQVTLQLIGEPRGVLTLRSGDVATISAGLAIKAISTGLEARLGVLAPSSVPIVRGELPATSLVDELEAELRRRSTAAAVARPRSAARRIG